MPLKAGTYHLSSPFDPRDRQMHWWQDFAANDGTPIYAAQAGSVQYIRATQGFGQWIVIDHPAPARGGTTVYGHMWDAFATRRSRAPACPPVSTLPMWKATANPPAHTCASKCTPQSGGRALKLIPCRGWRACWIRERRSRSGSSIASVRQSGSHRRGRTRARRWETVMSGCVGRSGFGSGDSLRPLPRRASESACPQADGHEKTSSSGCVGSVVPG